MPGLKKFMLGGLDLKSNDLLRDPVRSSSMKNVTKTQKGDLDKRHGYELVETAAFELEESVYYKSLDQDIFIKSDGTIHKPYLSTRISCSIATLFANVGLSVKNRIVSAEYLGNLYLTTSDGKSPVIKYDGGDAYLAGLPAPTSVFAGTASTISSAGAGYYYRFFYRFKDLNGNLTYGPYKQMISSINNAVITVSTFKTSNPYGEFYNKYLTLPVGVQNLNSAAVTLNYTSTNYVVGDKFLLDGSDFPEIATASASGRKFAALTITNITAGVITFLAADFGDLQATITPTGAAFNIDSRSLLMVFRSSSESFGYTRVSSLSKTSFLDNSVDDIAVTALASTSLTVFEDVYNEEQQKLRPPLCKYLAAYGDQLVYANIVGVWDQENAFTQYNNDDLIIPSDFGIADNGENHSAYIQRIGETYDGSITGVSRCGDVLMVTKDNGIYSLDGVLEPGGYNLRKIPTNYIGCKSHNSILQVESGVFFHGNDGIYFSDGNSCQKMSLLIDPFFNSIDATLTKSTVNSSDRKFLFYMTDNTTHYCVVYDYEFKEWFIWEDLDMSHGLYEKNSKVVYFAKDALLNKFNTGYSDAGVLCDGEYKTNWEDIRNPSLDKKFKYIRIWNLTANASSFNLKIQKNWVDTDLETLACTIPAYSSIQKGFDQRTVQAIRFVFQNNTLGEGMPITAYEIDYEAIQALDKGN
jgi:hypothetical protein